MQSPHSICRLSCDDNEGESLSIENQKKLLTQYADEKGFFNTRFYVDDGISGTTFERDLKTLAKYYDITDIQPFDMFPHTRHVECVVAMSRKAE